MGQQSNKIQKRRRRLIYMERKKLKAKEVNAAAKPRVRKPVAKKEKSGPAPAASAAPAAPAAPAEPVPSAEARGAKAP
jgi:hypothetical protein